MGAKRLWTGASVLAMILAAPAAAQVATATGPATARPTAPTEDDATTTAAQATAVTVDNTPAGRIVVTGTATLAVSQVSGAEIQKILPGISPLKALQTLPGVTYLTTEPRGNNEQNISLFIHGFNAQQLGPALGRLAVDG